MDTRMAGTDHGEVLTRFDKVFGDLVEHEVIKLILQSCEWDTASASDTLLGMIDKDKLPPHVLSALTADSIVRGFASRQPTSPEASKKQDMGPQVSNYTMNRTQEDLEANAHANPIGDVIGSKSRSPQVCTLPESTSEKPIVTLPPSASAFPYASPSTPHHIRVEERGNAGSPLSTSTNKSGESVSSSPSFSPLRLSKSVTAAGSWESSASQWVLAPEFVPNAFNLKSSDVGNKSGLWVQGMSSRLMSALPPPNAVHPKLEVKRGKLSKKEEIVNKILQGTKIIILMRGLPGSGKSSLARELKGINGVVLSTDDFFCDKHGKYNYDASKIGEAHQWNKHRASQMLKQGKKTPIIIDNTNLQRWEMKPYVELALQYGYDVDLLEADSPWRLNPKELAKKNSHGVPSKKIEEMKERYELNLRIEDIVADLQGTKLTRSSPSKNSASKVHVGDTSGNDLKGTEVTKRSPSKSPKRSYATNHNCGPTAPNNEFIVLHPSLGEYEFESDDDVVIEGYDEEEEPDLTEMNIDAPDDIIQVIQVNKNISESDHDIKEAPSREHEQLNNMCMSEETENEIQGKENDTSENFDSFIDLTPALVACSTEEEERKDKKILVSSEKGGDESNNYAHDLENEPDASDEKEIQHLLDEATKTIDINKSEEEWDNLVSHICGEDFSDEKFNDLVTSFGSALKKQIENKGSRGISDTENGCVASESASEDFAMYDLISTVEDKMGQSLTSLVTKLAKSDGATDMPLMDNAGEKASNFAPSNTEPEAEDLSRNLSNLKVNENSPDISHGSSEGTNELLDNDQEHNTSKPLPAGECKEKKEDKDKHSQVCNNENGEHAVPGEVSGPFSQINTSLQIGSENLVSWECVDINSGVNSTTWDSKPDNPDSDRGVRFPKPSRTQRNRMPGDPTKWLKEPAAQNEIVDEAVASWVAVESGIPQWDSSEPVRIAPDSTPSLKDGGASPKYQEAEEPQSHTGAVSKFRKHKRCSDASSSNTRRSSKGGTVPVVTIYQEQPKTTFSEAETQTLSIDFEALELDHDLYELKVLFGKPHYVPVATVSCNFSEKGPLTKGGLRLEKGTMTDNMYESSVSSFQNLVAFFPNIPKEDLRDVYEKCRYDSDWAMNVLLDSGYEMSDPGNVSVKETEATIETDSVSETTNTDDGKNDESSCDTSDVAFDNFVDERTRKIRQSKQPDDLAKKVEIEKSFAFPESVDDRVLRLTGKQYSDLNMTKVKKSKNRKQHGKGNSPPSNTKAEESVEEEAEGAQYVTLVMDPLFASQLNMMFGPVGDYEISGDLTFEDRSVVLPLEICEMIHKYWARTVNGKFKHEAEILDSLVRQDEILARKLQEEENASFNLSDKNDVTNDGLLEDKPVCFQEIMDLEQALQESLADQSTPEDTSISSVLNLKRLYKEYPHVDPVALKEEYTRNGFKYHMTVEKLNQRFGKEQGTPKTVIAPEALSRYEQEIIERAQQESRAEEEAEAPSSQHDDIVPDDPQVFRDEAQAHYHQRQEAFQKAQEASRRGMKAAAAYYAYIGNLHSEKLHEANQRASQKILEAQNAHRKDANCLDLHLLHVPEARSATQAFLHERQRVLIARGIRQMEVSLITGRGVHSAGGQAVLKPAIKEHLKKNGYSFYEVNSGMLKVILRAQPS